MISDSSSPLRVPLLRRGGSVTNNIVSDKPPSWEGAHATGAHGLSRVKYNRMARGLHSSTSHFSAELEPCLSQENTLHTLNTP